MEVVEIIVALMMIILIYFFELIMKMIIEEFNITHKRIILKTLKKII